MMEGEMFEQTIETSATPQITVAECTGDLVVRGSDKRQVTVRLQDGADDVVLEREGETLTLTAHADCTLTCPSDSTLTVRTVRGDLKVKGVQGTVAIGDAYGNVGLRAVGPVAIEQVFGNLSARQVRGSLEVKHIRGSIRLGPPFPSATTYRLSADGNLTVRLPDDASLRLVLRAGGKVRSRVPGLILEEEGEETRGILGAGEAILEARVGGNVYLRPSEPERVAAEAGEFDFAAGLEGLGATIESHIAEAMAEMEARLEEGLSRIDSEEIRSRMERAAEKARRAAERAAERARQKAEREAERARLRAERAERRWRRASGRRPRPRREPAVDEERLRVLRLVEQGKITPGQAADLLAALEGR